MVYINNPYGRVLLTKMMDNIIEEDSCSMLNGIYNDGISNNSNYISRESNIVQISDAQKKYATSPFKSTHFIDETSISNEAMNLYQKEQDVKKFTSLVLSDDSDMSHLALIEQAFSSGVKSPFTDDMLETLLSNQKFLDDING